MSDIIGEQFHSISASGMAIFDEPIESTIGAVVVDLASAPIEPGEHVLEIDVTLGGVEIYLPRYVQFTVERSGIGGQDIHEGLGLWERLTNKLRDALHLPNKIPQHAVENPDPSKPIKLVLAIKGGIGGVDIYRI